MRAFLRDLAIGRSVDEMSVPHLPYDASKNFMSTKIPDWMTEDID
jgi:hypothetical protein